MMTPHESMSNPSSKQMFYFIFDISRISHNKTPNSLIDSWIIVARFAFKLFGEITLTLDTIDFVVTKKLGAFTFFSSFLRFFFDFEMNVAYEESYYSTSLDSENYC